MLISLQIFPSFLPLITCYAPHPDGPPLCFQLHAELCRRVNRVCFHARMLINQMDLALRNSNMDDAVYLGVDSPHAQEVYKLL